MLFLLRKKRGWASKPKLTFMVAGATGKALWLIAFEPPVNLVAWAGGRKACRIFPWNVPVDQLV